MTSPDRLWLHVIPLLGESVVDKKKKHHDLQAKKFRSQLARAGLAMTIKYAFFQMQI